MRIMTSILHISLLTKSFDSNFLLLLCRYLTPIAPGNDDSLYGTAQIIYFVFLILVALILMNLLVRICKNFMFFKHKI